jgi:hypothetical protein
MQMTLDPATGDEMAAVIADSGKLDAATKAKLKDILFK